MLFTSGFLYWYTRAKSKADKLKIVKILNFNIQKNARLNSQKSGSQGPIYTPEKLLGEQFIKAWLKNAALVIYKCNTFNVEFVPGQNYFRCVVDRIR